MEGINIDRYLRHVILPEVGYQKQKELKNRKVLIVGLGALGSVISVYLAAFGVGYLRLIDFDRVSIFNLHRQVFYKQKDLSKKKAKVIKKYINEQNPEVFVDAIDQPLSYANFQKIFKDIDLVIDATDRLSRKFLINDVSKIYRIPFVFGSIYRFEGMAALFWDSACLRCLFNERFDAPSCEDSGVFTPISIAVSSIQLSLALKFLLGIPFKKDTLFVFDLLNDSFFEYTIKPNRSCLCNNIESLKDSLFRIKDIEVKKINKDLDIVFDLSNVPALKNNRDLKKLEEKVRGLANGKNRIVFSCRRGEKSLEYAKYFRNLGFNCFSLINGNESGCIKSIGIE